MTSLPAAAPDPYVGTVVGERYRVLHKLGQGAMGAVYLAQHVVVERKVALKILIHGAASPDLLQRFIREARAAARIGHEGIVEVYDYGETRTGAAFLAMEYLEGQTLGQALRREAPLPLDRIRRIAAQICQAMQAAHDKGIVHRDLKPDNIFLLNKGGQPDVVKILDFGIAKLVDPGPGAEHSLLTHDGMICGTPTYMAPEQASAGIVDHRADIYAMGCILYELLTVHPPFRADKVMAILTMHLLQQPAPPSSTTSLPVPRGLDMVCLRALAKQPQDRFDSMAAFWSAIDSGCSAASEPALVPRRWMWIGLALSVGAILLGISAAAVVRVLRPPAPQSAVVAPTQAGRAAALPASAQVPTSAPAAAPPPSPETASPGAAIERPAQPDHPPGGQKRPGRSHSAKPGSGSRRGAGQPERPATKDGDWERL